MLAAVGATSMASRGASSPSETWSPSDPRVASLSSRAGWRSAARVSVSVWRNGLKYDPLHRDPPRRQCTCRRSGVGDGLRGPQRWPGAGAVGCQMFLCRLVDFRSGCVCTIDLSSTLLGERRTLDRRAVPLPLEACHGSATCRMRRKSPSPHTVQSPRSPPHCNPHSWSHRGLQALCRVCTNQHLCCCGGHRMSHFGTGDVRVVQSILMLAGCLPQRQTHPYAKTTVTH